MRDVVVREDSINGTLKEPLASGHSASIAMRVDPELAERLAAQRAKKIVLEMVTRHGMDPGLGQRIYAARRSSFIADAQDWTVDA